MKKIIKVDGMKCPSCEKKIEKEVMKIEGVRLASADCGRNTLTVEFEAPADIEAIKKSICRAGYDAAQNKAEGNFDVLYIFIIILGLYIAAQQLGLTAVFSKLPMIETENIGYALLFVTGLFTSVHCIAMCSGINLAQSTAGEGSAASKNLLYNLGRLTGYTCVGAVLGLFGEAVSVTFKTKAVIGIAAGGFMILSGINLLGNFGFIKKMTIHLPNSIMTKTIKFAQKGAFAIGVINALMPCGPLQSIQLYAVACGSIISGALSMFFFCLGTIPLMFIFGAAAGALKKCFRSVFLKIGAAFILFFGIYMLQNNFALLGIDVMNFFGTSSENAASAEIHSDGKQYISAELKPNSFVNIKAKNGVPLVWTISVSAESLNGCNNEIIIPEYNTRVMLTEGINTIEFTPSEEGKYIYTCGMGMIKNVITVTD